MTLSLCMIVRDEAQTLPRCLESVRACVDEMVIVDTGSQDETVRVAQEMGARVVSVEWTHDFAAARNQSLALAAGDWILVLDADETLMPAGQALLKQVRAGLPLNLISLTTVLAINLLRYEVGTEQTPYSSVSRLFRNRPDVRFNRPYHETVDDSIAAVMEREPWQVIDWPEVALEHTGYQPDAVTQRDKVRRAETAMAAYIADHPDDAYICNKLGALYGEMGDWERSKTLLLQGLAFVRHDDAPVTYELHYHLALAERSMGNPDVAANYYRIALDQTVPEILKVGAYINLGSLRQKQQDFRGAIQQFSRAVEAAPEFAMAYFNLGTAQRAVGRFDQAIAAYRKAISLAPNYAEAYQNLGVALFKLGKVAASQQAFQDAIALYRQADPAAAERLEQGLRDLGLWKG